MHTLNKFSTCQPHGFVSRLRRRRNTPLLFYRSIFPSPHPPLSPAHSVSPSIVFRPQPIYLPNIYYHFFTTVCFWLFPSDCIFVSFVVLVSCLFFCLFLFLCLVVSLFPLGFFVVSFIVSLVKFFVCHIFVPTPPSPPPPSLYIQLYVNELAACKQQACWWAHDHSLYLYFVLNQFLFKPNAPEDERNGLLYSTGYQRNLCFSPIAHLKSRERG